MTNETFEKIQMLKKRIRDLYAEYGFLRAQRAAAPDMDEFNRFTNMAGEVHRQAHVAEHVLEVFINDLTKEGM